MKEEKDSNRENPGCLLRDSVFYIRQRNCTHGLSTTWPPEQDRHNGCTGLQCQHAQVKFHNFPAYLDGEIQTINGFI